MENTVNLGDLFKQALKKQSYIVHPNKKKGRKRWSNQSGFYRVQKIKCQKCKNGYTWGYCISTTKSKHKITRTDILKLKKDIQDMGFGWFVVDEEKALKTAKKTKYPLDVLR